MEALIALILLIPLGAIATAIYVVLRRSITAEIKKARLAGGDSSVAEVARINAEDRARSRELYERITNNKLEVIKTALAMGYKEQELKELDARLEKLIGSEQLNSLLDAQGGAIPPPTEELLNLDLSQELESLKRDREAQAE